MPDDLNRPADDALLDDLLAGTQRKRWPPSDGALLEVGDPEVRWALASRAGELTVEEISRGVRHPVARFSDRAAAYRWLVLRLAEYRRADRGWPPIDHRRLAPRAELTDGPQGRRLTWPGGWAVFSAGHGGERAALSFSWAAQVTPEEVVDSYGHVNGAPLFDLGITDTRPWTDPPPRVSTLRPRPVETPPPDPGAAEEVDLVGEAAAEIGWTRRPDQEGDVLAVGDQGAGRVVSYRLAVFRYQSYAGDWRATKATFSTAAAARRFLLLEVGTIARLRRRDPLLRVRVPAVDATLTKGPTELLVEVAGIRATFPLGPVGQQHAYAFTYCAAAPLAAISASYRDPAGAPLL